MNRKFISSSNRVLRKILNSKENVDILQDLIESLLEIEIKEIAINPYLKLKSKYLPKEENFGIADVRVILKTGQELNIGVQFVDGYYIQNKMLLYYAQIHSNQLEHDKKRNVAKTITINLLDFVYFKSKKYHEKIIIKQNEDSKGDEIDQIEIHTFELPKLKIENYDNINSQEAWLIYLYGEKNRAFNMVITKYEKINKLDNLLDKYWKDEKME